MLSTFVKRPKKARVGPRSGQIAPDRPDLRRLLERTTETRTRDPTSAKKLHGGCLMRLRLSHQVPELHVLGALVSCVSPDRWSRLHFVDDFVGVGAAARCRRDRAPRLTGAARGRDGRGT